MGETRPAALFCVVANVAGEAVPGPGDSRSRPGTRHFAAGAKVWVLPPQWGDGGEQVIVAGYHRGARGRGLVRMIMARRHLTRFRVQAVYSPAVERELTRPLAELGRDQPPALWPGRAEAMQAAARWRGDPGTAPPPAQGTAP
jgi:hypothetical protein